MVIYSYNIWICGVGWVTLGYLLSSASLKILALQVESNPFDKVVQMIKDPGHTFTNRPTSRAPERGV